MTVTQLNVQKMRVLEEAIKAEGESIEFTPDEVEKIGRRYLIACSKNDQDERLHRAEVMEDAFRKVIF